MAEVTLWDKMIALYPFVGGNATAHSHNLKSTSYQVTWNGGITHDANGVQGNGSTGYGICTGLTPQVHGHLVGMSAYIITPDTVGDFKRMMGSFSNGSTDLYFLDRCNLAANEGERCFAGGGGTGLSTARVTASKGTLTYSRLSTTDIKIYLNGNYITGNNGTDNGVLGTQQVYLLSVNANGTAGNFTTARFGLMAVHQGLNTSEVAAFNQAIQLLQLALNRAVLTEALVLGAKGYSRADYPGALGTSFYTNRPITVTHVARWVLPGNTQAHDVIINDGIGGIVARVSVPTAGKTPNAFAYVKLPVPVTLKGQAYHTILSVETAVAGSDQWANLTPVSAAGPDVNSGASAYGAVEGPYNYDNTGMCYIPVNFMYF